MTDDSKAGKQDEVVGLIPAGGRATRVSPLPCSKELYPLGTRSINGQGTRVPKVACHYLLDKMRRAGITKVYFVLREGKWDIPAYLGDGTMLDMHVAYLIMGLPFGVPYTLDQAYPFVRNATIAFGFPDIVFDRDDAFMQVLARKADSEADIILGLFPADHPHKVDMVDVDGEGRVRQMVIRPKKTDLHFTWGIAVWTPVFTRFIHEYVAAQQTVAKARPELSVGEVVEAAIRASLRVRALTVSDQPYLDIGTPEDLVRAVRTLTAD